MKIFRVLLIASGAFVIAALGTSSASATPIDVTPPSMFLSGSSDGPPDSVQVTIQDSDGGLGSIAVLADVNANVSIPSFVAGDTAPIIVAATETNPGPFSFELQAVDLAGNTTTGFFNGGDVDPGTVVPEPSSLVLLGSGLLGLAGVARRKLLN